MNRTITTCDIGGRKVMCVLYNGDLVFIMTMTFYRQDNENKQVLYVQFKNFKILARFFGEICWS